MTARGAEHVETMRDALECPACGYSLRGLDGDVVTCPECGEVTDIPQLIAREWKRPWWDAPLYNTVALPLAWAFLVTLALPLAAGVSQSMAVGGRWMLLGYAVFAVGSWGAWLVHVAHRFGSIEGLWLALFVHLVMPLYIGGLGGFVGGLLGVFVAAGDNRFGAAVTMGGMALAGVMAFAGGRLIERYVAHRCIRRHLRRGEGHAPPAASITMRV